MEPKVTIAINAARLAAKEIHKFSRRRDKINVFEKGPTDFVTQVDSIAENLIINTLKNSFPDHSFEGEESGRQGNKNADYHWIIDPLDGTTNFIHDFPFYSISIACFYKGSIEHGLIYDLSRDDEYYASKGKGAFCNKTRIRVSEIKGLKNFDKVIQINQSPIGRTSRSNPATYTGAFTPIRDWFAGLPEAKTRGYKPGRFSFNVSGGRCENCKGGGMKLIEMNFLPDVFVECEECNGKRFNRETLEVRYKGKSISDVLDMSVSKSLDFFSSIPKIYNKLKAIESVGLGYITLGQSSTTLSGGESQRIKLASELSKRDTGKTVYILDEPTTGLHFEDIRILLKVLNQLVDKGNTIIIIEHNLDVIKQVDHIIDIGPEGGKHGGRLIDSGSPKEIIKNNKGYTATYLSKEYN